MKKRNIFIIAITSVLAISAVIGALLITNSDSSANKSGSKEPDSIISTIIDTQEETDASDEVPVGELETLVLNIMGATDAETVKKYISSESFDNAQALVDSYTGTEYDVTLEYATKYDDYIIFSYSAFEGTEQFENGYLIFTIEDNNYKLCVNQDINNDFYEHFGCSTCGNSGTISTGATSACGICGGTGQQYIPNLYYDAALGWQGGYTGCSGCGGAGHTGAITSTCPTCNGHGVVVK